MVKPKQKPARRGQQERWATARLLGIGLLVSLSGALSCSAGKPIAEIKYECATEPPAALLPPGDPAGCGTADMADMEPTALLTQPDVCQVLSANRSASDTSLPSEENLDTARVQAALTACSGRTVKLVADGANNAFITSHLNVIGVKLWVDAGVTLYASRNPALYQRTPNCGVLGVNDSKACSDYITVGGTNPAIIGDGVIDGQGGEPLVGHDYSWWELSYALRSVDGSIGNPTLIALSTGTTGFVLYRITLHNSPKFHVKLASTLPAGQTCCDVNGQGAAGCSRRGKGFTVWGITLLTPSKWKNSQGVVLSPAFARNTDGVDPGAVNDAQCGLIACNTISTGDDHIAIKGGHRVTDLTIAHNHFGTGHGMSIGSETYGTGIERIDIYDLTIDADSRPVGADAQAADFNGIRVKSDESRGGLVQNITYRDVCMRDMNNAILLSTAYNPLFSGSDFPKFGAMTFTDVRHVSCKGLRPPVVTLNGFSALQGGVPDANGVPQPAGPYSFDNVVIDNTGPQSASAQFSRIVLGPGPVDFGDPLLALQQSPTADGGQGLTVTDNRNPALSRLPKQCVFPTLPAPHPPAGWTW